MDSRNIADCGLYHHRYVPKALLVLIRFILTLRGVFFRQMEGKDVRYDILIIGDSHIPDREKFFPEKIHQKLKAIKDILPQHRFDLVLFTGDFTDSNTLFNILSTMLEGDLEHFYAVVGNMDGFYNTTGKISTIKRTNVFDTTLQIGSTPVQIGMIHGHQIRPRGDHGKYLLFAKEKGYNILVTGHTHADEVQILGKSLLLINPGSCTGSWSFLATETPSFVHLQLQDDQNSEKDVILAHLTLYILSEDISHQECFFLFEQGHWKEQGQPY